LEFDFHALYIIIFINFVNKYDDLLFGSYCDVQIAINLSGLQD